MSGFTGTGRLLRLAVRRDRVVGTVWVLGLFVFAVSQAASIVSLYPTQADLDRLARTAEGIGANPAVVALQGPAYDASTYGGATAWQVVTPGVFLIGLMSLLLVTRHTRQEEETGRAELVSAGVVGRYAWLAASLLFVLAVNVVLAALSALGYVAMGLPAAGSVALAVACGLNGLVFAGVAAVTAQLTEYARPANGMAFAVLGVAFLLRAVGDSSTGLSWLSWLSPIGWAERFQPFAGERWAVLLLPVALLLVLLVAVAALLARRDLGAGVLADPAGAGRPRRPGWAARSAWPGGCSAAPWLGWAVGAAVAGLSFGGDRPGHGPVRRRGPGDGQGPGHPGRGRQHHRHLPGRDPVLDRHARRRLRRPGHPAAAVRGGRAPGRAGAGHRHPRVGWAGSHLVVAAVGLGGRARHRRAAGRAGPRAARRRPGRRAAAGAGRRAGAAPGGLGHGRGRGAALFGLLPRLVVGVTWASWRWCCS